MQLPPPAPTNETRAIESREQSEHMYAKMNEKLLDTFKGTLQEQKVNANSTGRYYRLTASTDFQSFLSTVQRYQ
ncbi:unnamed protein product [Rotaria sp. Silwood2]|nr:unnamed protein product [Rotaria sp. Silwood2]CAF4048945.1 unnamed protein product [Rotaria sp. Silwood2]